VEESGKEKYGAGGARARARGTAREANLLLSESEKRGAHSSFILIQHDLQQLAETPHDGPSDKK